MLLLHIIFFSIKPIKTLILGPLTDKTGYLMKGSFLTVVASSKNEIKLFQVYDLILKAVSGTKL